MANVFWILLALRVILVASDDAKELYNGIRQDKVSYNGAQLWRIENFTVGFEDDVRNLEDEGVLETWAVINNHSAIDIFLKPDSMKTVRSFLTKHNAVFNVSIANLQDAIDTENPVLSDDEISELAGRNGHRMTWQMYHRMDDLHGYLKYLEQTYPKKVSLIDIGNSVNGRPLKVLKINSDVPNSPGVWVDGGIHAREWISPASVTYVIKEFIENRSAQSSSIRNVDWYILPLINPDGYEHSHTHDRLWRKNRSTKCSSRCVGIDLNRNFGYKWGGKGAGHSCCQEIFAGPYQFSEPETSAIASFVKSKGSDLKAYISFHSYGQYILYPWGYDSFVPPDHGDLERVGRRIARSMQEAGSNSKYTVGSSATTLYPASGGSDDWARGEVGIKYTYTIELKDTGVYGFILPSSFIVPTGKEAVAALTVVSEEVLKFVAG